MKKSIYSFFCLSAKSESRYSRAFGKSLNSPFSCASKHLSRIGFICGPGLMPRSIRCRPKTIGFGRSAITFNALARSLNTSMRAIFSFNTSSGISTPRKSHSAKSARSSMLLTSNDKRLYARSGASVWKNNVGNM